MNTSFEKSKNSTDEWYTPKEIIDALGEFDLDPCAPMRPLWRTARVMYNKEQDGLKQKWEGRVWLNPPYSRPTIEHFITRMVEHNNGIALLFNRLDNKMFQDVVFPKAKGILFMKGRIKFHREDGTIGESPGCGSILVAFGEENAETLRSSNIEDVFHKISRKIVDLLIDSKITKLVVGYNKGWKQNVNIGKKNNQKFTQIPFARLVSYLEYKCELAGIEIVIHEESYTSKCDFLAFEKIGKHENYLGKRKKRGLFQSSVGKLINADVNGALNIMRKVVGDSCESIRRIIDRGLLFNPVRITNVFC